MIKKILIANRGEIACRIIRTAKALGISTVAVYSDADANSQHVKQADEAVYLGGSAASESYLRGDLILEHAKRLNVDAIHPGYGFLSENAAFSQACQEKGVAFIGPGPEAIRAMGSKSAAKAIMEKAGVPLVPGYHGDEQSPAFLHEQARKMSYPVLLKAAAGGGGKGMRQVHKDEDFLAALEAAKREAMASFSDNHMLIEKYLTQPRHVEIQVFCDNHGNGVYLFERDCSVQRRHQKIIEEAPAPGMFDTLRKQMGEAALKAAKAINYSGAGTVEFLLDSDGRFYFMEMNTRLQVEHPVTEMITSEDLVAWQIQVADNQRLPKSQDELSFNGHAFEARIYAEDPDNEFLPATGVLNYVKIPQGDGIRVDTGVVSQDEVSIYYDPMIAKLIAHGENREQALLKLIKALNDYHIVGVTSNIDYLLRVASSDAFTQAQLTTDFVERHADALKKPELASDLESLSMLAYASLVCERAEQNDENTSQARSANTPFSKFAGFRLNHRLEPSCHIELEGETHVLSCLLSDENASRHNQRVFSFAHAQAEKAAEDSSEQRVRISELSNPELSESTDSFQHLKCRIQVDLKQYHLDIIRKGQSLHLFTSDKHLIAKIPDKDLGEDSEAHGAGEIAAPMNGTVVDILVKSGDKVSKGDAIAIVEAMKMEHSLKAPFDGTVGECFFQAGERVDGGATLLIVEADE
uniref:acetyl-CoA carboxylase biotin carboxylase subunit n=1 Tax=Ningiella ruwaisensis TaxID=2364274 RepID=UPI00109FE2BE|nr:acetyl/propionyl/methylcrotonyl-CoA carboxylase subunit alpha [Ningiella ruwaisensis]